MGTESIKDFLSRRDPKGYYVIPAKMIALNDHTLTKLIRDSGAIVEPGGGDIIFIKVKSRSKASRLVRYLMLSKLLAM